VHVPTLQGAPLDTAELVEYEQGVITGAVEMAVVGTPFLLAIGRALARIPVEHDRPWRPPLVHVVDPLAGKIDKRGKVLRPAEPPRFEAPHLAR
jgi:hypothetical protein